LHFDCRMTELDGLEISCFGVLCVSIYKIQGLAVDESVQIAMKIVANCVNQCELQ
jgi:hypothetical protein